MCSRQVQPSWHTQLAPGITAVDAHGHTARHTIYAVESKGQKLMLWGDLVHVAAVQFPEPQVTIEYRCRFETWPQFAQEGLCRGGEGAFSVGSAHLPFRPRPCALVERL